MAQELVLVSHGLCPYAQRVAISLGEKGVPVDRVTVDLADKPDWFKAISPLGKVPLLRVDDRIIFESAAILEYLEDTIAPPLHPSDPLQRAEHRAWIEYSSTMLNNIAALYNAPDEAAFDAATTLLATRFQWLEQRVAANAWFDGAAFSLVDAAFAPVFRYFDAFDAIGVTGMLERARKVGRWRAALAARPSVQSAVSAEYPAQLRSFLSRRNSYIARFYDAPAPAAQASSQSGA
jgi:glutathione S-transferase